MEPQIFRRRIIFDLLFVICVLCVANITHAQMKFRVGPVEIRDQRAMTTTKTTITGPGGTRTISSQGTYRSRTLPGYSTSGGNEEIQLGGVENTGVKFERRVYYVPQSGQQPGAVTSVPVSEGNGTIQRSYESETRSLPPTQIQVGR